MILLRAELAALLSHLPRSKTVREAHPYLNALHLGEVGTGTVALVTDGRRWIAFAERRIVESLLIWDSIPAEELREVRKTAFGEAIEFGESFKMIDQPGAWKRAVKGWKIDPRERVESPPADAMMFALEKKAALTVVSTAEYVLRPRPRAAGAASSWRCAPGHLSDLGYLHKVTGLDHLEFALPASETDPLTWTAESDHGYWQGGIMPIVMAETPSAAAR